LFAEARNACRSIHILVVAALLASLGVVLSTREASAIDLPSQFVADDAVPSAGFDTPVGIAFFPSGRMLVAEKRGVVYSVFNGVKAPNPMIDLQNEVLDNVDRGFLGVAIDPNYAANRFVYFLYTVDPDTNGVDSNDDGFGRLVRYTVSPTDSTVVLASSRTILMGRNWREGPLIASPSHTIGSIRFGRDGSLLVSTGDGAQYTNMDDGGQDPQAFGATKTNPQEDIGAFRAQYMNSLCGKILRLNPANGHGYPSNPFYNGDETSIQSRIWAYGLRNPFRFTVRPGTGSTNPANGNPGTLYIGNVGWATYEEMEVASQGGRNFGWPCYEGPATSGPYQGANPPHDGCNTLPNPNPAFAPLATWHHDDANQSIPPGFLGNASIGGVFYTGTSYPAAYQGRYFFGDYGQSWIKLAVVDANNQLLQILDFANNAAGPVDFATNPVNGDLYYVSIGSSQVFRIRYTGAQGGNSPPTAVANANPDVGTPPLVVNFSSAGTFDIDNDPIQYSWAFGDGQGSISPNPQHTYTLPGVYNAVLTVDDGHSGVDRDTVRIICAESGNFPTTTVLDGFNRANGPLGANWVDPAYGMAGVDIVSNQLHHACCYQAPVWLPNVFGPDQECYITITQLAANEPGHDLMLKVQGNSWDNPHLEVRYDDVLKRIGVATYTAPGPGWEDRGFISPVTFVSGDQLGARAFSNGTVEVYKNGLLIGQVSIDGWPYAGMGGRIGLTLDGTTGARFDNFGGGNTVIDSNTPPNATILNPPDGMFYAAGDLIQLNGTATDAQDPISALTFRWEMDIHHNNHVHPNSVVQTGQYGSYIADNHDDGTGVFDEIRLIVTDTGAKKDTARVFIYPEIDLEPSAVTVVPSSPGTTASAEYSFWIRNRGRMPAPLSRWRLTADNTLLAQGDIIVPARDSVFVSQVVMPTLAQGTYTLRLKADSLAAVVETNELNNAVARPMTVVPGNGPDNQPPIMTNGPLGLPHENSADIVWQTNEPTTGSVLFGKTLLFSDSLASPLQTQHDDLLTGLEASTRYYFQVVARDTALNATVAPVDSFLTTGTVAVNDTPLYFDLSGAFPNPSRGSSSIQLALPHGARVGFAVLDVQGRQVWSEPMRDLPAGRWRLDWPGRNDGGTPVATGVYLARISVDGRSFIRRIAILR
jgi:glucose/arabinose dehydrogenase